VTDIVPPAVSVTFFDFQQRNLIMKLKIVLAAAVIFTLCITACGSLGKEHEKVSDTKQRQPQRNRL
jgi:hypothetical protein